MGTAMTFKMTASAAAISIAIVSVPAAAQATQSQEAPQAGTPPAAASTSAPAPICTDRPTKANAACTVPMGDIQIEADFANWTHNSLAGTRTDTILYTNPTIKYGLGPRTDIEVNIAPYETVRTRSGGVTDKIGGVGDLYVRLKQELTDPSAKVQVSLIPYVKAPTAKVGIGNGKVEGGVIAPVVFALPAGLTLNFGPEVDVLADADGHGHHAQVVSLVNLAKSIGKATLYAEFWNAQNFDPAQTVHQYSADVAVTYLLNPTLQLDVGGNFGLNDATPDAQLYVGISTRF